MTSLSERLLAALDDYEARLTRANRTVWIAATGTWEYDPQPTAWIARERRWVALGRVILADNHRPESKDKDGLCYECWNDWPCPTVVALAAALSVPLDPQETP